MKRLMAAVLIVIAAGLVFMSVGALANLWADYRDNGVGTYIAIGGVELALAVMVAAVAVSILRAR
jgi:hypothetical protein